MPFDGSGNYTPLSPPNFPAVTGQTIVAAYYNNQVNDLAAALDNCLTRDGQGKPSASINWNGQKITNLANGVNPNDAVNFSQLSGYALLSGATFTGDIRVNGIGSSVTVILDDHTNASGSGIQFIGNGVTTPNKTLRVVNGQFRIANSAFNADIFTLDDSGNGSFAGGLIAVAISGTTLTLSGAANITSLTATGAVSLTGALTTGTAANSVGYLGIPQAAVHTVNYQFVLSDQSIDQAFNGASLVATIPANALVAFPIGAILIGTNLNASSMTVAITTDILIWSGTTTTGTRTIGQNGEFRARKITATSWLITGTAMS